MENGESNGEPKKPRKGRKKALPKAPDVLPPEVEAQLPKKPDYRQDPVGYCRDVLGITLTPMQKEIFRLVLLPPYRVLVSCGVGTGKSWMGACFISWLFDCFVPSVGISTAPTTKDIREVIWGHVRDQRVKAGLGNLVGNVSPELRGENTGDGQHYSKGYAVEKQESFRGRHQKFMGFVFDESTGISPIFWESTKTMWKPRPGHFWICFFNPIDTSCYAYKAWQKEHWHKVQMGCLDHPNVMAELRGEPEPFEGTVSKDQIDTAIQELCDPIDEGDTEETDIQWPPVEYATAKEPARWYRPGPYFESNFLGRWPSSDVYGVWSRYAWKCACQPLAWSPTLSLFPEFGCDPAGHGDNDTAIIGRWGPMAFHHEFHNGWTKMQTANRLKMLCADAARKSNLVREIHTHLPKIEPEQIVVKIDADGMGADLVDLKGDFRFVAVCGSGSPMRADRYKNKRAESWFQVCQMAKDGHVCVGGTTLDHAAALASMGMPGAFRPFSKDSLDRLEQQLLAPQWTISDNGKIVLEDKDETKKRLSRSPDDADAFILAFGPSGDVSTLAWQLQATISSVEPRIKQPWEPVHTKQAGAVAHSSRPLYDDEDAAEFGMLQRRFWSFGSQQQ